MFNYRGITAHIVGHKCIVTDCHNNSVSWKLHTDIVPESHLDSAIQYLRGFVILPEFLERVEEI